MDIIGDMTGGVTQCNSTDTSQSTRVATIQIALKFLNAHRLVLCSLFILPA